MAYAIPLTILALGFAGFVYMHEKYGLLSTDHFRTRAATLTAYAWLATLLLILSILVIGSSQRIPSPSQLSETSFWSLFSFHVILVGFLAGWWAIVGRPPLKQFFNLQSDDIFRQTMLGVAVGVGGWAITIFVALIVGLILTGLGLVPDDLKPSPMIPWMAALPIWKKALIILSAMTVEELFFRGWLQKRVGLIISTIVFALAHAGYGQPLMLIGITVVSIIIGLTFYKTRSLWPCIVAHGVFDAIQLFVIVPIAVQMGGLGG